MKYKTIGDFMETFVQKRLPMYEVCRVMMIENLEKQMCGLDAKQQFIQAILNERLVLSRRSGEDIVAQLKACGIPASLNVDAPDAYDSYDTVYHLERKSKVYVGLWTTTVHQHQQGGT